MGNEVGEIIFESRKSQGLTQDQYGQKYGITGPAVFKFEKGFVRPSMELWVRLAKDAGLSERRAVLLRMRSRLPEEYKGYIDLRDADKPKAAKMGDVVDYSRFENGEEMRKTAGRDKKLPKGLLDLLDDDVLWSLFKPTGHEINMLRDRFAPLGKGSKEAYGDALRLIREFTHSF